MSRLEAASLLVINHMFIRVWGHIVPQLSQGLLIFNSAPTQNRRRHHALRQKSMILTWASSSEMRNVDYSASCTAQWQGGHGDSTFERKGSNPETRVQTALGVGKGHLINSSGIVLDACASIEYARVQTGDALTWHVKQVHVLGAGAALAATPRL